MKRKDDTGIVTSQEGRVMNPGGRTKSLTSKTKNSEGTAKGLGRLFPGLET